MTTVEKSGTQRTDGISLLLAEAEESDRRVHVRAARRAGFRVDVAADGHEALAKALVTLPDVVVTEVRLPGLGDLELVRRMRRNPRTWATPVIVWTELPISDLIEVARECDCTALISRSCAFGTLARAIRRVVRNDRGRDPAKGTRGG